MQACRARRKEGVHGDRDRYVRRVREKDDEYGVDDTDKGDETKQQTSAVISQPRHVRHGNDHPEDLQRLDDGSDDPASGCVERKTSS